MADKSISQSELARQVGRSVQVVNRHIKRDAWPFGKSPWPASLLPKLKAYFDRLPRDKNAPAAAAPAQNPTRTRGGGESRDVAGLVDGSEDAVRSLSSRAKLQVLVERAAKIKLERGILEGKYLLAEEVEDGRVARVLAVKAAMLALPDSGVVELMRAATGGDAEAKTILRERLIEICQEFAGKR